MKKVQPDLRFFVEFCSSFTRGISGGGGLGWRTGALGRPRRWPGMEIGTSLCLPFARERATALSSSDELEEEESESSPSLRRPRFEGT